MQIWSEIYLLRADFCLCIFCILIFLTSCFIRGQYVTGLVSVFLVIPWVGFCFVNVTLYINSISRFHRNSANLMLNCFFLQIENFGFATFSHPQFQSIYRYHIVFQFLRRWNIKGKFSMPKSCQKKIRTEKKNILDQIGTFTMKF